MRIVFVGCVDFSRSALEKVLQLGGNVVGICTLGSSAFNADHADLRDIVARLLVFMQLKHLSCCGQGNDLAN
jgi:hypothetical protein